MNRFSVSLNGIRLYQPERGARRSDGVPEWIRGRDEHEGNSFR